METRPNESSNLVYITVLNVLSALAVVGMHMNGCFWQFSREHWWITIYFFEAVFLGVSIFSKDISQGIVTIGYVIDGVLNSKFNSVYWFLAPLFGVYLSIPLFACLEESKK